MGAMRIHVVADDTDRDGGHVVERLLELGAELVALDRDHLPGPLDLTGGDLVLLLGSTRSAHDPGSAPAVEAETGFVLGAVGQGVPVLGICYGAQLLARALGGHSYRADDPELGWRRVDTIDPVLCPEGPWGQFHQDVLVPPPDAEVLGTSWYGPQCFVDDSTGTPVLAWQFHPEVTAETYARWVDDSASLVRTAGADPDELKRQALAHAVKSRIAAHALVDAALAHLRVLPA